MGINVKKLNRVRLHSVGGIEVLETLNSGVKKPAFRQNGYEVDEITKKSFALGLDSVNSEYLDVNTQVGWNNLSDVNFSVKVDLKTVSSLNQSVYCDGNFNQPTTGILRLYIKPNGTLLNVYISGISNGNNVSLDYNLGTLGVKEIGMNGVDLLVDGLVVHTFTDRSVDLTSTIYKPTLGRFSYPTPPYLANFTYYNFNINGEPFNLTEGLGNQVYGSNGTIATINTSNAQGIERINFGMWLKGDDTNGWNPYI
tara:strand:- start:160 stop:921 length:762 start_codon:yes stop_codon:yes gene_type:complete